MTGRVDDLPYAPQAHSTAQKAAFSAAGTFMWLETAKRYWHLVTNHSAGMALNIPCLFTHVAERPFGKCFRSMLFRWAGGEQTRAPGGGTLEGSYAEG